MNRAERRSEMKRRKAISRELVRMEKPEAYGQGYHDGGVTMCKACEAAFASAMAECNVPVNDILTILRIAEDRVSFFAGEDELIHEAFEKTGIIFTENVVFSEEKFDLKKEEQVQ